MARLLTLWLVTILSPLGLTIGIALAAPEDYQGKPLRAISFSPEQQPYPREYLDLILPLKLNEPLHLETVQAAIARLYATGRYDDIKVDATLVDGGVYLRFFTAANFFIGHVSVEGVPAPPNAGVLVNATRLQLGTEYTESGISDATRNLHDVLRNNGFYTASIHPEFERDEKTQQMRIHFMVDSGKRARYQMPVVTGNPGRTVDQIARITHWKGWLGWKPVNDTRTQDGVQRVRKSYLKGDHLEARVSLDGMNYDAATNRATPSLSVEGGPRIRVVVEGAKVSRGKLSQLVPVFEEQSVDRDLLVEGKKNLTEYFESDGFFDAKVDFTTRPAERGQQLIIYEVDRGQRHTVAEVTIQGNHYFQTDTLRERMYVRPASLLQFRHGRYSDNLLKEDLDAIASLYRANGFRDVEVTSRTEDKYQGKERNMAIRISIQEGTQWLVGSQVLEGVSPANRSTIDDLVQSQKGQPYSEFNIAVDRDNILEWYFNQGYSGAQFQWTATPSPAEPQHMDVAYTIREGQRRFVRDVVVSGLGTTNPKLVNDRVNVKPGDPLSRARILETQRRLYDLGIFARVDTALQNPQGQEDDRRVLLDVEEAHRYTFTAGLGAEIAKIGGCTTCLDAPAGQAGFSPRAYFGVTRRNFFGVGHIVSFQSRVSNLEQRAVLTYQAPQFRGSEHWNLLFSGLFDDSRDVRTFTARRREASAQVGQKLSRASTLLYRFSYRRVNVSDLKISSVELIPFYSQPVRLGMASVNYIEDRRDDPLDSHRGVYNTLDAGWAPLAFGSQTAFTRLMAHNATYHPFGFGTRFVLARSTTFGWEQRLSGAKDVPLPEKFFAGGAQSHRGFPENQAGPRDPETGFPLGGKALLMNQTELRHPLIGDNIRGVLFWDAGNVYSGLDSISFRVKQRDLKDFDYMVHAVGYGVRYKTPVGPIRIDLAWSINPPRFFGFKGTLEQLQNGTGTLTNQRISRFQFHFSLGQAF